MLASARAKKSRTGFTLIELLVVIAIIAVILGLFLAAVVRLMGKPDDIQNRKDIDDLHGAVEKFKEKYHVYPPSKIMLSNDPTQYVNHPLGPTSLAYLTSIWPKLDLTKSIDWSGGTMPANPKWTAVLEGDQCLVYFLGGVPSANPLGCRGFADSNAFPTTLNNSVHNKVPPFFDFKGERLYQRSSGTHTFLSYKDAYTGQPFAYFATKVKNVYNDTDCTTIGAKPYYSTAAPFKKYINDSSFQIISAGRDKAFGAGNGTNGAWDKTNPSVTQPARDDQSNFHPTLLSLPSN